MFKSGPSAAVSSATLLRGKEAKALKERAVKQFAGEGA